MSTSVVCNTSLPPPSVSNDPPAGIGALVTNSTLAFVSVSEVSDSTVTVAFIADPVTLPSTNPVSYTQLRAHETPEHIGRRLLL